MAWLFVFCLATGLYTAWSVLSLARNYLAARKTGFPIRLLPVNPTNPVWLAVANSGVFSPWLAEKAPRFLWHRLRFLSFHASYLDQFRPYDPPEPAVMVVTPGSNLLWVHDTVIGDLVLARRKDFLAHDMTRVGFSLYGPNVMTSDGDDWLRYRKLFSKGINEKVSRRTWDETVQQSREMMDYFLRPRNSRTADMIEGVQRLVINVQLGVQYDTAPPWEQVGAVESPNLAQRVARDLKALLPVYGLMLVLPNAFLTIPRRILAFPFLGRTVKTAALAGRDIPGELQGLLDVEREALRSPDRPRNTFLSNMLQFLENEKEAAGTSSPQKPLTDKELVANLFLFTLASFDTTANALSYAIAMLAIYPEWQDWIGEEIDALSADQDNLTYEDFTKLPRCLALMYETLRLFPATNQIPRSVAAATTLHIDGAPHHVPAGTQVWVVLARMQYEPATWGPDHLAFRPSRFTEAAASSADEQARRRGFLPWSRGPRQCPGMKLAQIEFVAAVAAVFGRARVECARRGDETAAAARERTRKVVRDSAPLLAMQVNRPKDVVLVWRKKD